MSDLTRNAAGRLVPTEINGMPAVPYAGVGKYRPTGRKAAPPIRTCADYPADGNKVVTDLNKLFVNPKKGDYRRKPGVKAGAHISTPKKK